MTSEAPALDAGHRVGFGRDRHPFGPGEPLRLGGVDIPGAPRLHGHSDGDVAVHAVAGAILGAAGLGDLGRLAPSDARTPRGVASTALLEVAHARAREAGWRATRVDLTITGARPRLGEHLDAMAGAIGRLLGLPTTEVSVKASSGNLHGPDGEGRAVTAEAIVTLARVGPR